MEVADPFTALDSMQQPSQDTRSLLVADMEATCAHSNRADAGDSQQLKSIDGDCPETSDRESQEVKQVGSSHQPRVIPHH
jgi:hypothetical protein